MGWLILGLLLGGAYGYVWARVIVGGDPDGRSIREWERQQAEWRGDFE